MSDNTIAVSLMENCERFGENVSELAREQGKIINNRIGFLHDLIDSSIDRIVDISKENDDMTSAKSLICELLKLEIKKFVDEKSSFDQTLGKIVVTNEVVKYIKNSLDAEDDKNQAEKNRRAAEDRVQKRVENGDDLNIERRGPGEHPEKLKYIRNTQGLPEAASSLGDDS